MSLKLRKFDMKCLRDDAVVVMIGKRNTGKSFLTLDILHRHRDIPLGTIISPSESANGFYGPLVPSFFIHDEYTPELLERIVKRQNKALKQWHKDPTVDPRSFLVMDDCMYENTWKSDKNIRQLFMNGRHLRKLFIITMQYPLGIPPVLRTNVDYVFILRENFVNNRKRIFDNWAGMFPTFNIFCQVMDQCTENFECLVINNTIKSNKIEDIVYWYKAPEHPTFKLGANIFWKMAQRFPPKKDEDDDGFHHQQKKGAGLNVQKLT